METLQQHVKLTPTLGIIAAAVLNRSYYLLYSHLTAHSTSTSDTIAIACTTSYNKRPWKIPILISKTTSGKSFLDMFTQQWKNRGKKNQCLGTWYNLK